eukprot:Pompholyxophrys_punicea_v1_NODE_197_length_2826_cov_3.367737.p2 type:complete len:114 gc:universal NODE_197_length_2826_cov_3.367737:992-1333(+)
MQNFLNNSVFTSFSPFTRIKIVPNRARSSSLKPVHCAAIFGFEKNFRLVLPSFVVSCPCFTMFSRIPNFSRNALRISSSASFASSFLSLVTFHLSHPIFNLMLTFSTYSRQRM